MGQYRHRDCDDLHALHFLHQLLLLHCCLYFIGVSWGDVIVTGNASYVYEQARFHNSGITITMRNDGGLDIPFLTIVMKLVTPTKGINDTGA